MEVGRHVVGEDLMTGGFNEGVTVGMVDVVGEGLAGEPVLGRRVVLGDLLVVKAEVLGQRGQVVRRLGREVPGGIRDLGVISSPSIGNGRWRWIA